MQGQRGINARMGEESWIGYVNRKEMIWCVTFEEEGHCPFVFRGFQGVCDR